MAILIVEAEETRLYSTQRFLHRAGYQTDAAPTLTIAEGKLASRHYEFVLLAQALPDGDGLTLLQDAMRREDHSSSFILTDASDVDARLRGFAAGADDCLARSVSLIELERRLRTIRRQRFGHQRPKISFGKGFVLDLAGRLLRYGPQEVYLSRAQFDLVHHLLRRRGQAVTREELGAHLGKGTEASNYIDVHVRNVRKALARHAPPDFLQTVRGIGYLMAA
ncbi:response regulator transcription factor [Hymenobacter negativus]|uniref:Response regulator transcription factor n=1 Tax=Hymenobacter negativus TaxID=2795026 RepID=A0ABS3QG66_9BACT|nr:response regulator transcription factor [Hymenobacter negativus]MBO2010101.1 response regulator transcription factor [Hymenobacter negativus]